MLRESPLAHHGPPWCRAQQRVAGVRVLPLLPALQLRLHQQRVWHLHTV